MTLQEVRRSMRDALMPKYTEREATSLSRAALMSLKGWSLSTLMANEDREASDYITSRIQEITRLLLRDVPLQYVLGETVFYGLSLKVGQGVLIPRPETEELVDLIVKENSESDLKVLDLCTGSGAIALALARYLPFSQVTAVDISPKALSYAIENARNLKIKVDLTQADIFQISFPERSFDIIVSNPPYVGESEKKGMEANVLDYEPHEALFVPDDNPLLFYKRIAEISCGSLVPGGRLYLEINPLHAEELVKLLESNGFVDINLIKDVHGNYRFASAKTPNDK